MKPMKKISWKFKTNIKTFSVRYFKSLKNLGVKSLNRDWSMYKKLSATTACKSNLTELKPNSRNSQLTLSSILESAKLKSLKMSLMNTNRNYKLYWNKLVWHSRVIERIKKLFLIIFNLDWTINSLKVNKIAGTFQRNWMRQTNS